MDLSAWNLKTVALTLSAMAIICLLFSLGGIFTALNLPIPSHTMLPHITVAALLGSFVYGMPAIALWGIRGILRTSQS